MQGTLYLEMKSGIPRSCDVEILGQFHFLAKIFVLLKQKAKQLHFLSLYLVQIDFPNIVWYSLPLWNRGTGKKLSRQHQQWSDVPLIHACTNSVQDHHDLDPLNSSMAIMIKRKHPKKHLHRAEKNSEQWWTKSFGPQRLYAFGIHTYYFQ